MAVAVPSSLPMKLWRTEPRGKAAAPGPDDPVRVLVTVTVLGSAGPLRFIVLEGDTVAALMRAALRCYAREGRMPLLGTDPAAFVLACVCGGCGEEIFKPMVSGSPMSLTTDLDLGAFIWVVLMEWKQKF